jgi:ketosteroid isomerase-like protein
MTHREALESLFTAWRTGDALRSAAHFALDGVYREARRAPIEGRDAIVAHFTRFFRDGPRFAFHPEDTVVEGDRAAVRYRFEVAGDGDRFEVAGDGGRWIEKSGCAFVRFSDGTIAEWREYEG